MTELMQPGLPLGEFELFHAATLCSSRRSSAFLADGNFVGIPRPVGVSGLVLSARMNLSSARNNEVKRDGISEL